MERTYLETVSALAAAVEARDKYTRGHSKRVTEFAVETAKRMGMAEASIRDLEAAALLHDIGKIGIPDRILSVADSFDAMISDRSYKPRRTRQEAIGELMRCKGRQFDPGCVDAFVAYLEETPAAGVLVAV